MASIHEQYGIPGDCKMLTMVGAIRPVKDQLYLLDTFNGKYYFCMLYVNLCRYYVSLEKCDDSLKCCW